MTNISAIGVQLLLSGTLTSEQSQLSTLNEQLASGQQYSNLTDYAPTEAKQLIDFQNGITQRQSYLSSITNVQNRLSVYDSTMTDMENLASQASTLASQNQSYNSATASQIQSTAQNYLLQVSDDLNQQIGGRYIYAGTRYTTPPVSSSTTVLNGAPQPIITDGSTLPDYDAQVPSVATSTVSYGANLPVNATVGYQSSASTVQVYDSAGTSHSLNYTWTKTGANSWDLQVDAPDATQTVTIPFNFDPTTDALTSISAGTGYNVDTPANTGDPATVGLSLTFPDVTPAAAQAITLSFGSYGKTTGNDALDASSTNATVTQNTFTQNGKATTVTNANAYTTDTALIDNSYSLTYGVSSDNPAFQKLVNGLRYMNAAVTAGQSGDNATYQTDMQQATTMLNDALSSIQGIHAQVAGNQNTLTTETTNQNSLITSLQDQVSNIQSVNTTQVATEIQLLQTQLEASYSTTGSFLKLSLVNYL